MWQTPAGIIIGDNEQYIGVNGTQYVGTYPKNEILYPSDYWNESLRDTPQLTIFVPSSLTQEQIDANKASTKDFVWSKIKFERERRQALGVLADGKWFNSDANSRIQQLGLLMMGANIPSGLQWKTMDNSFITMTPALAEQIFQATAYSDVLIFTAAEQHKAAMEASASPLLYDFSGGWPVSYGE